MPFFYAPFPPKCSFVLELLKKKSGSKSLEGTKRASPPGTCRPACSLRFALLHVFGVKCCEPCANSDELIARKGRRGSGGAQFVLCAAARGGCVFLIHLPVAPPFPRWASRGRISHGRAEVMQFESKMYTVPGSSAGNWKIASFQADCSYFG